MSTAELPVHPSGRGSCGALFLVARAEWSGQLQGQVAASVDMLSCVIEIYGEESGGSFNNGRSAQTLVLLLAAVVRPGCRVMKQPASLPRGICKFCPSRFFAPTVYVASQGQEVKLSDIRFTQDTVSEFFRDG